MVYDLCIIGCGPAGFAGASRAWDYGMNVCVIEKSRIGGTGIHCGALSSKTLWEISEDFKVANSRRRGYIARNVECDFEYVKDAVEKAQSVKEQQMEVQLKSLGIQLYNGEAKFISKNEVVISSDTNEDFILEARNFLVTVGGKPRQMPDLEEDGELVLTSDTVMNMEKFPKSMIILGAGVIGCEYATMFANFKRTKVFLVEKRQRILPFEDQDIGELISERMIKKGVTIHHASLEYVTKDTENKKIHYAVKHADGTVEKNSVDVALVSIGRVPRTNLGLEKAGIDIHADGSPVITDDVCTSDPHIFFAGDSTAGASLVNVSELEARKAIRLICGRESKQLTRVYSTIMFLDPKVSAVGYNEQQLHEKKIEYKISSMHFSIIGRAIAKGKPTGFLKLLVTNDDEMRVLGIRALGQHSSTVVDLVAYLISTGQSIKVLDTLNTGYPSMSEVLFEAARLLTDSSILKPKAFGDQIRLVIVTYDDNGNPLYSNIMVPGIKGKPKLTPRRVTGWPVSMDVASFYERD